jgi:hypothetical protein
VDDDDYLFDEVDPTTIRKTMKKVIGELLALFEFDYSKEVVHKCNALINKIKQYGVCSKN